MSWTQAVLNLRLKEGQDQRIGPASAYSNVHIFSLLPVLKFWAYNDNRNDY